MRGIRTVLTQLRTSIREDISVTWWKRKREPRPLRAWVALGTAVTTGVGLVVLLIFARLQAGLWVWTDGFFLNGTEWFDAARTTVTLIGIIGLGGAAFLAYRKQLSTESAHVLTETSALRVRYTTCAEQLGNDNFAIRLAGVYALASLADDWHMFGNDDERQVCIDLLCAYLRTSRKSSSAAAPEPDPQERQEREVGHAIVSVIRDHTIKEGPKDKCWTACRFSLAGADLTFANLGGADLTGAYLRRVNLRFAILEDATLAGANLTNANLTNANLTGANLTGADLTDADLTGAVLRDANLTNANLTGADLTDVYLTGAYLGGARHGQATVWPKGFVPPPTQSSRDTPRL